MGSTAKFLLVRALAAEPRGVFDEAYRVRHSLPVSSTLHTALKELVEAVIVSDERVQDGCQLADPFFARCLIRSPAKVYA